VKSVYSIGLHISVDILLLKQMWAHSIAHVLKIVQMFIRNLMYYINPIPKHFPL